MYELLKLATIAFVLPPGGTVVLGALGVWWWRRRPRLGRWLCAAGTVALWLASLPIVAASLVTALGGTQTLDIESARKADAIVILGGGVRRRAPEYGGDTLGRLTLERVRYGAYLAKQTGLAILVTGGAPKEGVRAEAQLMREALVEEYGIPVRWMEDRSRSTRENAANSARMLHADNIRRVVLVMHGFDVRRTKRQFENAGLEVIAAPTLVATWDGVSMTDFLPSAAALLAVHFATYEIFALGREAAVGAISGASRRDVGQAARALPAGRGIEK